MAKATQNGSEPENKDAASAEIKPEEKKIESTADAVRPEMDITKSHKERILLFIQSRKTHDFVRIDGFLKALFPIRPNEKPGWADQRNMINLRNDLLELQTDRKLVFSNNNFDQLGRHYWDSQDAERRTRYHNVMTVVIEARLA